MAVNAYTNSAQSHFGRERFTHQPLDLSKPSIRLLEVHPDLSHDGLIQCTIVHATTEAEYTCLSYMWEPPDIPRGSQAIIMNGSMIHIQQNLFDFLGVAGTLQDVRRVYWIDALCINQQDGAERNHQVQQMGDIYSKAAWVVTWLGKCSNTLAAIIPDIYKNIEKRNGVSFEALYSRKLLKQYKAEFLRYTFNNPYWRRAWVTQEIQLAQRHTILLGQRQISMRALSRHHQECSSQEDIPLIHFAPAHWGADYGHNMLVRLMDLLKDRECSLARDRVFSLLSLCDERTRISVDYSCSKLELMYQILDHHQHSHLCFCCAAVVAHDLELADITPSACESRNSSPYIEIDLEPEPRKSNDAGPKLTEEIPDDDFLYGSCSFKIKAQWISPPGTTGNPVLRWSIYFHLYYTSLSLYCDEVRENMTVKLHSKFGLGDGSSVICRYGEGIQLLPHTSGDKLMLRISFWVLPRIMREVKYLRLCSVGRFGRPESRSDFSVPDVRIGRPEASN
jgi:hypothetical protein